ncbi:MAG: GAF domain-containing protein [Bacteroidales bacterium]|nr:GAF domain-containing protein [Bacteroidales bacterium]
MKKLNLSVKSKLNFILVASLIPFVVVGIIFGYLLFKTSDYEKYEQKVVDVKLSYLHLKEYENSFLLNYPSDNVFFKTTENEFLRRFDLEGKSLNRELDEIMNMPATTQLELGDKIYMLKENAASYGDKLKLTATKIYQRGSFQTGIIGELELCYQNAVQQNALPLKVLTSMKEMEVQYLNRKDVSYYNEFLSLYTQCLGSMPGSMDDIDIQSLSRTQQDTTMADSVKTVARITAPKVIKNADKIKSVNDFKRYFTALVKIDKEIGFNREEGLLSEIQLEKAKLNDIDSIISTIDEKYNASASAMRNLFIAVIVLMIIVLIFTHIRLSKTISSGITRISSYLQQLSKGVIPDAEIKFETNDELSDMADNLNTFSKGLKQTTEFATAIGGGNLDTEFKPLSDSDVLGNSLLEMRSNLYKSQLEDEKRQHEDSLRKWANEGLTQFAEILRQSTSNIHDLANNVLKNLIHFLDANQGGLFLYNDTDKEDIHLELVSSYAYNQERKKKKKIYLGEGLIGTCAIEKSYVYLTDLPNDYLTITSGLGGSNPSSLLIMPLKVEETIFGVLEIASFKKMERHEIDFVEKVSESIASTLSIAKINQRTAELLAQSQQQAEEMASQEEEMRQNLEELQATQEESARKEAEMQSILNAVHSSSLVIEYDLLGHITSVNDSFCRTLNIQREQAIGRNQDEFRDENDSYSMQDSDFWSRIKEGEVIKRTDKYLVSGEEHWLQQVFTPILDSDGFPYKILNMATDITNTKKQEIELQMQTEKMTVQEEKMRKNLEELQITQENMATQQAEMNEMNEKLKENEEHLTQEIEKSQNQEKELKNKVEELNKLHKELELQKEEILEQNKALQEKEMVQTMALENADKNMERTRLKIMAEFVWNLERQCTEMENSEKILTADKNLAPEVLESFQKAHNELKILIAKYKAE